MNKFLLACMLSLMLISCGDKNIELGLAEPVKIPELPVGQFDKVGSLPPLEDPTFGAQQLDAAQTDIKYNEVGIKYNRLIDFYNCIRESINNDKEPECLITK